MQVVTQGFRDQIPLVGKRNDISATIDGSFWKPDRIKYMFKGNLFKTAMTEVEVDIKGAGNLIDRTFSNVQYGLLVDGAFEYIEWTDLYVYKCEVDEDKRLTKAKAYDRMIEFMVLYNIKDSQAENVLDYVKEICTEIGIELYSEDFYNADLPITEDYFLTQKVTYRDVLDQVAETTFTNISIKDGKLWLRDVKDGYDTPEQLGNNVVSKGTTNSYWGDVNTFNIGREPQSGDDAYVNDASMINAPAGKNIFDVVNLYEGKSTDDLTIDFDATRILMSASGTTSPQYGYSVPITIDKNENYTFSCLARKISGTEDILIKISGTTDLETFEDITQISQSSPVINQDYELETTFNTANYDAIRVTFYNTVNSSITLPQSTLFQQVQLEKGSERTTYEQFRAVGIQELRFVNNQFLDKTREQLAGPMFLQIKGLGYYPMKVETLGLGYLEFGDWLLIPDAETGQLFKTCATTYDFTVTSGTKDIITSEVPTTATGKYQYASAVEKRITNTEIIVDKQGNTITSITEEQNAMGNQLSQLEQSLSGFEFKVQESGNLNLVLNSVGWKGTTDFWEIDETGSVSIIKDTDVTNNSASKSSYLVNTTQMIQTVQVRPDAQYVASVIVKNSLLNSAFVRITNGIDNIDLCNFDGSVATGWTKFDATFVARSNFIYVIIYSQGNALQVTDLVVAEGELVQSWFPSADEIYTGNTVIDRDGVQVSNSTSDRTAGMESGEIFIDDASGRQVSLNPDLSYANAFLIKNTFYLGRLRWDIKDAGVDVTLVDE